MIHVIEKDYLDDDFIISEYINNISINSNIYFNKKDVYYFGNYKEDKINIIERKLISNKKNIINAIEKGCKILIHGNSIDLFNNHFNHKKLNIFTCYDDKSLRISKNNIKIKNKYSNYITYVNDINKPINNINFRYKNLICFNNINAIKKQSISTLLH